MIDLGHFLDQIKIPLIVVGIIAFILIFVFLYLLISGADESRRKVSKPSEGEEEK